MNKTNIMITVLCLLGTVLFTSLKKSRGFEVQGEVANMKDGRIITMFTGPDHDLYKMDTIIVKDGKFTYKGEVDMPKMIYFYFDGLHDRLPSYGFQIFMENSKIKVKTDLKNLKKAEIKGSKNHSEFERLYQSTDLFDRLEKMSGKISMAMKEQRQADVDSLQKERKKLLDETISYLTADEAYSKSIPAAFIVYNHIGSILQDNEKLKATLDLLDDGVKESCYVQFLYHNIKKDAELAIGEKAPDFTLSDRHGKSYKLSDFKGKMVLLDFGASWCHWCKMQKPYLQAAYDKYKDMGLEIIYISLDKDKEAWEADLNKENYPWLALSDLKAWQGPITKEYNISGVPHIFLIDRDGTIVENDARGERMEKAFQRILNKK